MYGLLFSLSFYGSLLLYCINVIIVEKLTPTCFPYLIYYVILSLQLLQYVASMHRAVEQLHYTISYWYNGGGSSRYFNDVID